MAIKKTQVMSIEAQRTAELTQARRQTAEADIYSESGLSAQQWQTVALLVAGKRGVDVAAELDISPETISRWRAMPAFVAALNVAVRDSYNACVGDVRSVAKDAVTVLRESLSSGDERIRLSAALAVVRLHLALDAGAGTLPTTPADVARGARAKQHSDELADMFM